jgi:hypothetical protein
MLRFGVPAAAAIKRTGVTVPRHVACACHPLLVECRAPASSGACVHPPLCVRACMRAHIACACVCVCIRCVRRGGQGARKR